MANQTSTKKGTASSTQKKTQKTQEETPVLDNDTLSPP